MLVLTRRVGESIMIGHHIKLLIGGARGNQVKIALEVPREISVHRQEIYDSIYGSKRAIFSTDNERGMKICGCKNKNFLINS